MMGVIEALKLLKGYGRPYNIELFSDSEYVLDGIAYMDRWAAKGWRTTYQTEVKNRDLWTELLELSRPHTIVCSWVEGHSGDRRNERCHVLANQMAMAGGGNGVEFYLPPPPVRGGLKGILAAKAALEGKHQ
jgi:ribonuclease HI